MLCPFFSYFSNFFFNSSLRLFTLFRLFWSSSKRIFEISLLGGLSSKFISGAVLPELTLSLVICSLSFSIFLSFSFKISLYSSLPISFLSNLLIIDSCLLILSCNSCSNTFKGAFVFSLISSTLITEVSICFFTSSSNLFCNSIFSFLKKPIRSFNSRISRSFASISIFSFSC